MIVETKDCYKFILFSNEENLASLKEQINLIFKDIDNLIIDVQIKNTNKKELILSLLKYSSLWKKKNKSFILVVNDSKIDYDKEIVCLPTLDEAVEYLYMEELERNV